MTIAPGLKEKVRSEIKTQEPMGRHTSLGIGGPADFLVIPRDIQEIKDLLQFCRKEFIPFFVFGGGTNLLVSHRGIRGLAVKLERPLGQIKIKGPRVVAGAGVSLPRLASRVAREGLSGLEFAAGIPGSAGGAAVINAGAYGSCLGDTLRQLKVLTWQGETTTVKREELGLAYRCSRLMQESWIVLEVELELVPGEPERIRKRMDHFLDLRKEKHPTGPSAGSVFRNPGGHHAGRLIEGAGCKGLRVGDAQVSHRHANFIVNLGSASFKDYLEVMNRVRARVQESSGLWLEPEINIVGEES